MTAPTEPKWPDAELDPIRRLRVLAACIPGSAVTETLIAATFDAVWAVASDLEHELPRFGIDVRSVRDVSEHGDRSAVFIRGRSGLTGRFQVVLRPGWCLMQSARVVGAMAAVDGPEGTRFALLGALRVPGTRPLSPVLGAGGQVLGARMMRRFEQRVRQRTVAR